jgi:7-cyano-7-deazaguanine synthase
MPIGHLLSGSALTSPGEVEVPEGHYAAESMAATVVPNRNQIMLSIALGVAHSSGAEVVATAVHAGDHEIYWDCRPDFIQAMDNIARQAIEAGYGHANIVAPYVNQTKAQIASWGAQLGVPFEDTWSCYKGGDYHCGRCGTCIERIEAFHIAGVKDPTVYQDMTMYLELRGKGKVR